MARGQLVASVLTFVMVAVMALAALVTSGRAAAAEDAVLAQIDSQGTRTIVVRGRSGGDLLPAALVTQIARVGQVESVVGLSESTSVNTPSAPRATATGLRTMVLPEAGAEASDVVRGSQQTLLALGLVDGQGVVTDDVGREYLVTRAGDLPEAVRDLEPLLVRQVDAVEVDPALALTTLVVVADAPEHVAALSATLVDLIAAPDLRELTMDTSQTLAAVRLAVAGELSTYSRTTALLVLTGAGAMVSAVLGALVVLRRRDYGRRRALGATRGLIVALLELQTAMTAAAGALAGTAGALGVLALQDATPPPAAYCVAVGILAVLAAALGALPPALFAATRQPITELRMP